MDRPNTVAVREHEAVSDTQGLTDSVAMLPIIYERIAAAVRMGTSLEEIATLRPTAEWDDVKGDPVHFLDWAFASTTR